MYAAADEPLRVDPRPLPPVVGPRGRVGAHPRPGRTRDVPWWPEERRVTTLGYLLVHLLAETAHHAGHADIVREAIDGRAGGDHDEFGDEEYVERPTWRGSRPRPTHERATRWLRSERSERLGTQIGRATDAAPVTDD